MRRALPLAVMASILLVGCAPNTDAAYKNCFDATSAVYVDPTLDLEANVERMVIAANYCQRLADDDPEKFVQVWGD